MHLIAHAGFENIETLWNRFEESGVATPYQTQRWIRNWSETVAPSIGMQPLLLTLHDSTDLPLAILPLGLQVKQGVKVARFLGGKHANYNLPVFGEGAMQETEPQELLAALEAFGKSHGIDLFVFDNQPVSWAGHTNPFALLKPIPSPSSAWKCALLPDGDALISSMMSSESRKKLRNKEKRLSEFGPIAYREASGNDEAAHFLAAFLRQKAERFSGLGIENPFLEEGIAAFLGQATAIPMDEKPCISLFAMLAGERILAVFGGAAHAGRYTGMFTSFDTDPNVSRFSPGDLLLINLIRQLCSAGFHTFDLGTGEAAYKNDYCNTREPLVDCLLPVTVKGSIAVKVLALKQQLKRRIKQSDAAMGLIKRLRKLRSK